MRKCKSSTKRRKNKNIRISEKQANQFQEMVKIKRLLHQSSESMYYLFNIIFNDFHQRFINRNKNIENIIVKKGNKKY